MYRDETKRKKRIKDKKMSDKNTIIEKLKEKMAQFVGERDWKPYYSSSTK